MHHLKRRLTSGEGLLKSVYEKYMPEDDEGYVTIKQETRTCQIEEEP
jgi:hypothetical protein